MKHEIQDCIGTKLRRLSRQVDAEYRSCLKKYDITENQLSIIFTLSKTGKIEQGKLGNQLALERSSMSRNIRLLEKKELIIRSLDYRPTIRLTQKGAAEVKKILPEWDNIMENLMEKIGEKGMHALKELEKNLS